MSPIKFPTVHDIYLDSFVLKINESVSSWLLYYGTTCVLFPFYCLINSLLIYWTYCWMFLCLFHVVFTYVNYCITCYMC